jgi:hypothetical protein
MLFGVSPPSFAQVGGTISGTVKDPSGGVVPGVSVTAVNTVLGTMFSTTTDGQGLYSFPRLPVARYDVTMQIDGFKPQKRTGIQVDADSALQINATLELGEQSETVTVSVNAVRVDTVSTQLGEVVASQTMTSLSLNGRSYTDLLDLSRGSFRPRPSRPTASSWRASRDRWPRQASSTPALSRSAASAKPPTASTSTAPTCRSG